VTHLTQLACQAPGEQSIARARNFKHWNVMPCGAADEAFLREPRSPERGFFMQRPALWRVWRRLSRSRSSVVRRWWRQQGRLTRQRTLIRVAPKVEDPERQGSGDKNVLDQGRSGVAASQVHRLANIMAVCRTAENGRTCWERVWAVLQTASLGGRGPTRGARWRVPPGLKSVWPFRPRTFATKSRFSIFPLTSGYSPPQHPPLIGFALVSCKCAVVFSD